MFLSSFFGDVESPHPCGNCAGDDRLEFDVRIIGGIVTTCRTLGCEVLAEGVETAGEYRALRQMGITLYQGHLFARPGLETLPTVDPCVWDNLEPVPA